MGKPTALRALPRIWFRFTDLEDQGKYGDGWFCYDEGTILRQRAREQIVLETALGMPLVAVMNGFRQDTILGDTAAAWLGVRALDPARAGDFDEFNPITTLIEWSGDDPVTAGKGEAPSEPMPAAEVLPLPIPAPFATMISEKTDTVALQTSPIAE
jgi:hypothetical protein